MRRLVLMRHAKTEPSNIHGDKARRLTPRGVQDAQEAGVELAALGVDHALVSTATRTRETFAATGLNVPVEYQDALYYSGTETMLARIGETADDVSCLLVIAHAPTIPSLTAELAYASDRQAADEAQCWYPTAAFSTFEFEGSWADLAASDLRSVRFAAIRRPR
ncbi:MAG: histidine phosphatase family protein [Arachnia sp.]